MPKKNLRFSVLFDVLREAFAQIPDSRIPERTDFPIEDVYAATFALFFFKYKSLLEFQRQLENKLRRNNLTTVFGITDISKDSQLRDVIDVNSWGRLL